MADSPCIGVCLIDDETGTCVGCGRTIDEIINWPDPTLPPINLNNSLSADKFYPDDEAPPNGMKQRKNYNADDSDS
jgi:hypothetical protein